MNIMHQNEKKKITLYIGNTTGCYQEPKHTTNKLSKEAKLKCKDPYCHLLKHYSLKQNIPIIILYNTAHTNYHHQMYPISTKICEVLIMFFSKMTYDPTGIPALSSLDRTQT